MLKNKKTYICIMIYLFMFFIPWDSIPKNDYIDWFCRKTNYSTKRFHLTKSKKTVIFYSLVPFGERSGELGKLSGKNDPFWISSSHPPPGGSSQKNVGIPD